MKNEKGFILPTTIVISFLFFLVFTHQLDLYMSEKRFYKEVEEQYQLEMILNMAVDDIIEEIEALKEEETLTSSYSAWLYYPNGQVRYQVVLLTEDMVQITMYCQTTKGRKYNARFIYDFVERKRSEWNRI
jgi:competence protein ComGG